MKIGVDYYPEQWDEALWRQDVDLMKQAGVDIVRMAEFAWSRLEPEEGCYRFGWLDRAVRMFTENGIEVFLGTPTCTPPQWMFEKYPEVIQTDKNGRRLITGIRGHRCLNQPIFRKFAERIIRQMVSRYKDNDMVTGYQIDNELEANHCCCPVCQEKFRDWLRNKYGSVRELNRAHGNIVWSGEYSSFDQIHPPIGDSPKWLNPGMQLDFNRYASDSTADYVEFQRTLIRECDEKALITTNNWLCENMPDFYKLFAKLDFVSYDNYPVTKLPTDPEEIYSHGFHLDLMRGIKQQNFWIMEQLSGAVGSWMPMSVTPRPGMIKGYSLQAIAHGADAVLHFRWRTGISGAEMYWHGILDHSNVPGRRFKEFQSLCQTAHAWNELDGSAVDNPVALLYGSDQEYAYKLQHQAEGMYYLEELKSLHDAFTSIGVGVDIIDEHADLTGYQAVLAPNLMITKKQVTEKLIHFAGEGGTVVLNYRCGAKDENNSCIMEPLPTVWRTLTGAHVTEYDAIGTARLKLKPENKLAGHSILLEDCWCSRWCDLIEPDTAEVLASYGEQFYEGTAAIVKNRYRKGTAYYLGTKLSRALYKALAEEISADQGIPYEKDLPRGVEITYRQKGEIRYQFLFNNTEQVQTVHGQNLRPFEMQMYVI